MIAFLVQMAALIFVIACFVGGIKLEIWWHWRRRS